MAEHDSENSTPDVFISGAATRVRPVAKGQGCLISIGLLAGAFVAFFVLMFIVLGSMDLVTSEDDRQSIRGIFLMIAGVALVVWSAGWVFRWNTRRGLREEVEARLPGFTGRTIPVGQLLNGPAAAGKLEGKYLMAVGQDRFLLMRHFHNTEHLDAFRALVIGQFINAYKPNGLARVMDFAIPYGNIRSVSVEALTPEQLRKGAFGRAVAHGLASWALDAAFGTRSTQDVKAAFIRIEMIDGQSLVFSVPSRVSEGLVSALAASAESASRGTGHEVSLGEATYDGIETLLSRSGLIDAPSDGWDDFFANLRPDGQRARSFAGLAAWRIQQEMDRAAGQLRPVPPEAIITPAGPTAASRQRNKTTLALWSLGLLVLGTLFIALDTTLRDGGNGDLELGLIVIFAGIALVVGMNLWSARSGWLMAGIKSVLSLILAAFVAFALGSELLLTRGPLAPMTQSVASATAGLFGRDHRPGSGPGARSEAEIAAQAEAEAILAREAAARQAAEAEAAEKAREQELAAQQAARLSAAEQVVRTVYDEGLDFFGSRTERAAWLTPDLIALTNRAGEPYVNDGGIGMSLGFNPQYGGGQDFELSPFRYSTRETDYGVEVSVRFTNFGEPVHVVYEMVETDAGWRARDIKSLHSNGRLDWSVVRELRDAIASYAAYQAEQQAGGEQ